MLSESFDMFLLHDLHFEIAIALLNKYIYKGCANLCFMNSYLYLSGLAAAPISEVRGALIYGLSQGITPWKVFLFSTAINIAIIPVIFQILQIGKFRKVAFKVFGKRMHEKVERNRSKFEKGGLLALIPFVGIPLPFTGAYTGIFISEILGFNRRKATIAIALGVIMAAAITFLSVNGILAIFS